MSTHGFLRGFFSVLFGIVLAWAIYHHEDADLPPKSRYAFPVSPWLLPFFLIFLALTALLRLGWADTVRRMFSVCFPVFLHICLYNAVLLALLPLLRRHFLARTVALLWLLPNFLYLTLQSFLRPDAPKLVLSVDGAMVRYGLILWAAGFLAVMAVCFLRHLVFRRLLLKNARPAVCETRVQWEKAMAWAELKRPNLRLVISPNTATPLSVGLFRGTTVVVLPDRSFSEAELELIFRHELVHILRQDGQTKLFLNFCTAMCWFNPLMWLAMRRCAEDLELSCDELVLEGSGDRRSYAALILSAAGDGRGFTTCLSAGAKSLRYRLKQITAPGRRLTGGVMAGVLFCLLLLSGGYVALSYDAAPAGEILFADAEALELQSVGGTVLNRSRMYRCTDPGALTDYVAGLTLSEITGTYDFDTGDKLTLVYQTGHGLLGVNLSEHAVSVVPFGDFADSRSYYVAEGIDRDYLNSLISDAE